MRIVGGSGHGAQELQTNPIVTGGNAGKQGNEGEAEGYCSVHDGAPVGFSAPILRANQPGKGGETDRSPNEIENCVNEHGLRPLYVRTPVARVKLRGVRTRAVPWGRIGYK